MLNALYTKTGDIFLQRLTPQHSLLKQPNSAGLVDQYFGTNQGWHNVVVSMYTTVYDDQGFRHSAHREGNI